MSIDDLTRVAPVLQALLETYDPHSTLVISDTKKYVYVSDKLGLGIRRGDELQDGSMTFRAVTTGEPVRIAVDEEHSVFNAEYTCACIPVFNGDTVCGALSWGVGTHQARLLKVAENLHVLSEQVSSSTEDYSQHATDLSSIQRELVSQIQYLVEQTRTISQINELITDLSARTKIIGLNASIEASRVGEKGRGFAVVAKEIRKLAEQSRGATSEITDNIQEITKRIQDTFEFCRRIAVTSEQQAAGAQELSTALVEVKNLAENLREIAEKKTETQV